MAEEPKKPEEAPSAGEPKKPEKLEGIQDTKAQRFYGLAALITSIATLISVLLASGLNFYKTEHESQKLQAEIKRRTRHAAIRLTCDSASTGEGCKYQIFSDEAQTKEIAHGELSAKAGAPNEHAFDFSSEVVYVKITMGGHERKSTFVADQARDYFPVTGANPHANAGPSADYGLVELKWE